MKRKLVYIGAAWGTGLLLAELLPVSLYAALPTAILIFLPIFKIVFGGRFKEFILIISAFISAFGFYNAYRYFVYDRVLEFSGESVSFVGRIGDVRDYSADKSRYILKGRINGGQSAKILVYTDTLDCRTGDVISLCGTLAKIENTYLFSSGDHYRSEGIFLETDDITEISVEKRGGFSLTRLMESYRTAVSKLIKSNLPERESGFVLSVLFGDKSGLFESDEDALYSIGIGHIMAVSGLHLMLFAKIMSSFFKRLKLGRKTNFLLMEFAMLLFSACCGFTVSVVRTFFMLTIVFSAPLFYRKSDTLNSLCIFILIMTLPCPFIISNPSFVLSVSGAWGAGVFAPFVCENIRSRQLRSLLTFLCIYLAVFPASVMLFGESSLISPITNMLLTPFCMAVIVLAILSAIFAFLGPVPLIKAAGALSRVILRVSDEFSHIKYIRLSFASDSFGILLLCLIAVCFCAYFIHRSAKYSIVSAVLAFSVFVSFAAFRNFADRDNMRIAFLGTDGGAAVISKGGTADVIDLSGSRRNAKYVGKYLRDNNIFTVNCLAICKKPYSAAAEYDHEFERVTVERVCMPNGYFQRSDMKICGQIPGYSDFGGFSVEYGESGFEIDNGTLNAHCGEFEYELSDIRSEKSLTDVNFVLICMPDGGTKVKKLEE